MTFPMPALSPPATSPSIFVSEKSSDGSRAAFSLKAVGMEYESDPTDSDHESIYDAGAGPSSALLEQSVECCIVATFTKELGIPCWNPDCSQWYPVPDPSTVPYPSRESGPPVALHRALVQAECTAPLMEIHPDRTMTFVLHPRRP